MNSDTLGAYLEERLKILAGSMPATWLRVTTADETQVLAETGQKTAGESMPLIYGEESVGRLYYAGCQRAALEAAAGELAAVMKAPETELAATLDRLMEKLKREEPVCDWAGVYLLRRNVLYLTAYRGAPTPHPIIPASRGICGAAVEENRTLNIEDVTQDPRYLSCDIRARSELVVPIRDASGEPIGEIDIDSHKLNAFHPALVRKVEKLAREISQLMLQ